MINCSICKFEVSTVMRHALTKNMCPACGSALLGDFHMQRLNLIKEKVSSQSFSKELSHSVIFDLSMFIMSEFFNSSPNRAESHIENDNTKDEEDLLSIREQIKKDIFKDNFPAEDYDGESEDYDGESEESEDPELREIIAALSSGGNDRETDLKNAKLKRLHNESQIIKKDRISVRRIS